MKSSTKITVAAGMLAGFLGISTATSDPALSETRKLNITPKTEITGGIKTLPTKPPKNMGLTISECRALGGTPVEDPQCPSVDGKRYNCQTSGGSNPCIDEVK